MANKFINNDFSELVFGRKSVRLYDETYKISHEEMLEMIQEATTAPSSVNLQPWRFVVVETEAEKAKLKPLIRFNTRQNDSSSAMVLIFGDLESYEYTEEIYSQAVHEGKMPQEVKEQHVGAIVSGYGKMDRSERSDIVKIDGGLAAMQLMLIARAHGYETNPIGGFEHNQLAEAFGLDKERYVPVLILAIGKAVEKGYESVRLAPEKITTFK